MDDESPYVSMLRPEIRARYRAWKHKQVMKLRLDLNTILRDWNEETRHGTPKRVGPRTGTSSGEEAVQLSVVNRMVVDQVLGEFPSVAQEIRQHVKDVCDSCTSEFGGVAGWDAFTEAVLARASTAYKAFLLHR